LNLFDRKKKSAEEDNQILRSSFES